MCSVERLRRALDDADAIVVGAGAGLSTAAGFTYTGDRLIRYFRDFVDRYGFRDMYAGGFYPFPTSEEHWAYWSRYIYINRYMDAPKPVYHQVLDAVAGKEHFVITTNVDHCFQKAGIDKNRLFYTQGDYGLWQCSLPCHQETYDNAAVVREMVLSQGFSIDEAGNLIPPPDGDLKSEVPADLVPHCPRCGRPLTMNLRADDSFVEDEGWHESAARYTAFLERHQHDRVLYWELGVGYNTPVIIKYPFWRNTLENPNAIYAIVNRGDAAVPREIAQRSIAIDDDIATVLEELL